MREIDGCVHKWMFLARNEGECAANSWARYKREVVMGGPTATTMAHLREDLLDVQALRARLLLEAEAHAPGTWQSAGRLIAVESMLEILEAEGFDEASVVLALMQAQVVEVQP